MVGTSLCISAMLFISPQRPLKLQQGFDCGINRISVIGPSRKASLSHPAHVEGWVGCFFLSTMCLYSRETRLHICRITKCFCFAAIALDFLSPPPPPRVTNSILQGHSLENKSPCFAYINRIMGATECCGLWMDLPVVNTNDRPAWCRCAVAEVESTSLSCRHDELFVTPSDLDRTSDCFCIHLQN